MVLTHIRQRKLLLSAAYGSLESLRVPRICNIPYRAAVGGFCLVPRFYPARNLIVVCIVCMISKEQLPTSRQLVDSSLLYTDPLMITNCFLASILTDQINLNC